MILFFEGYSYSTTLLKNYFGNHQRCYQKLSTNSSMSQLVCVGYYYNMDKGEHIYILPKVFLKSGKAFGELELSPDSGLVVQNSKTRSSLLPKEWQEDILYKLPVWLYSAIRKYYLKQKETTINEEDVLLDVISSRKDEKNLSLLDISLKLVDFYNQNENLFVFIYKESHKGYNKISWTKTIQRTTPIIKGKCVCYPSFVNRKKEVDYEEQLIVIFFNTLRYIRNNLIIDKQIETEYELYSDKEFNRMMKSGMVARMLQNIKENYYNEILVELWNLLYAFHKEFHSAGSGKATDDYLLSRKFNNVFEDMIDELIGDKVDAKLKKQRDDKIIDHLFRHTSLISNEDEIYYIGDSKYYKEGATPEGPSRYKQFTYAKNIIQTVIDWYNEGHDIKPLKYRDELTQGYNITPNFFITGTVNPSDKHTTARLERSKDAQGHYIEIDEMNQWKNKLFDRDTLFALQYDINFLFVLYSYTSKNQTSKQSAKKSAKNIIRNTFADYISSRYKFYILTPKNNDDFEVLLNRHFRLLLGKVFCPIEKTENTMGFKQEMILALEKNAEENKSILEKIEADFTKIDYSLDVDIKK